MPPRSACLFVAGLLCAGMPSARAEAPPVLLEAMTSAEVAVALREGRTTIIVPVGGTEQNGAHMTLGKHNRRVLLLSERIAVALGNAVVAPVIAYVPEGGIDPPTAHMRYAGTISVPEDVFARTLEAAARSFKRHGFRDIVLVGDHGGYQQDLVRAAERLNRAWSAQPARAHAIAAFYEASSVAFPALLRQRGFADAEIGGHAGLADTSLALALDPSLVRTARLQAAAPPGEGVVGDPRRASAEAGQLGVDLIVARTVAAIRRSVAQPSPPRKT